jgi:hypothetical protein
MAELPHDVKVRLVTLLARFTGPSEAARIVSEEHAVIVDRRMAHRYDASKKGCVAGPRYRELFHQVRKRWLDDLATVPIAHQAHRLRMLDRLATRLEECGDYSGALKALELAAKEMGGLLTKEKLASVPDDPAVANSSPADMRSELTGRLASLINMPSPVILPGWASEGRDNRRREPEPIQTLTQSSGFFSRVPSR